MSIALYRKYRPDCFQAVIGQEHVTQPLMAGLRSGRVNHAYLFSGPRGCGKTTSARIMARCLNCVEGPTDTPCGKCESCRELATGSSGSLDVVEIDAASHNSVDDARELVEKATFGPVRDRYKIFILDEAHMVTPQGFNALLKTIEEPPEHVKFILATTEPEKVLGTIRSRTHHYPFRLVAPGVLEAFLQKVCEQEGIHPEDGVLAMVLRAGGGSVRDSLSVLDQLMAGADENGTILNKNAAGLLGYTDSGLLERACAALLEDSPAQFFAVIKDCVGAGQDARRFMEDLLFRLRDLMLLGVSSAGQVALSEEIVSAGKSDLEVMQRQASQLGMARISRAADVVNDALRNLNGVISTQLQLELLGARLFTGASRVSLPTGPGVMPMGPGAVPAHSVQPAQPAQPAASAHPTQNTAAQLATPVQAAQPAGQLSALQAAQARLQAARGQQPQAGFAAPGAPAPAPSAASAPDSAFSAAEPASAPASAPAAAQSALAPAPSETVQEQILCTLEQPLKLSANVPLQVRGRLLYPSVAVKWQEQLPGIYSLINRFAVLNFESEALQIILPDDAQREPVLKQAPLLESIWQQTTGVQYPLLISANGEKHRFSAQQLRLMREQALEESHADAPNAAEPADATADAEPADAPNAAEPIEPGEPQEPYDYEGSYGGENAPDLGKESVGASEPTPASVSTPAPSAASEPNSAFTPIATPEPTSVSYHASYQAPNPEPNAAELAGLDTKYEWVDPQTLRDPEETPPAQNSETVQIPEEYEGLKGVELARKMLGATIIDESLDS